MQLHFLVSQFCGYSSFIKNFSRDTIRRYRGVIDLFISDSRITEVQEINKNIVRTWFSNGRIMRRWSVCTFLTYHKTLKVFFRWCIREGYLAEDPAADLELPKLERKLPPKLTKQEALRILETVYNYPYDNLFARCRDHAIFATLIFAGLRRQELLALKFADVDLGNLSIFVRQGKGHKDRIVPITPTLADLLARYLNERQRLGRTCPEFFASFFHNAPFPDIEFRRLIDRIKAASGIRFTAHMLRHTFATLMLEGGCDIYSLSKMLGHTDIKTTTIYLAASVEHLRAQINKHPLNNRDTESLTKHVNGLK